MGNKTLVRLLLVLVVAGAAALIVKLTDAGKVDRSSRGEDVDRKYLFDDLSPADIGKLRIVSAETEMNFVREPEGWVLVERDNFPADGEALNQLMLSASKLKIRQQPKLSKSSMGSVQLLDPVREDAKAQDSATVVSFIGDDGKERAALWLGKPYEVASGRSSMYASNTEDAGRYVRGGDSETVYLVEETFADIEPDPAGWLNDQFFQVRQVKSVSRDSGNAEEDWKLVRDDVSGTFGFSEARAGEEVDPAKSGAMNNAFASPRFDDVLVGEDAKQKPDATTFVVETQEGFTYNVKVGEKSPSGEYPLSIDVEGSFEEKREPGPEETDEEAKSRDEAFASALKEKQDKLAAEKKFAGRVFKVRSFVVDSVNKPRADFVKSDPAAAVQGPGQGAPGGFPGLPGGMPGLPGGSMVIPPAPAPKPEPASKPEIAPKTEPKPEVKPGPKPAPKADAKPAPKADAKPAPKADAKPAPKADAKPVPKADAKPAPKADAEPAPKADAKPAAPKEPQQ